MVKSFFKYIFALIAILIFWGYTSDGLPEPLQTFLDYFFLFASILFILLFIFLYNWGMHAVKETEENIKNILNESDEKLKRGEITQEENDQVHFYYECEFIDY